MPNSTMPQGRTALFAAVATAMLLAGPPTADADRMPPPVSKICNKTKAPLSVATGMYDRYSGWTTRGWTAVKPGACKDFRQDAFHIRGKHTITGLAKRTTQACVLSKKTFRLSMRRAPNPKADCAARKGTLVTFTYTLYPRKTKFVQVDVTK